MQMHSSSEQVWLFKRTPKQPQLLKAQASQVQTVEERSADGLVANIIS